MKFLIVVLATTKNSMAVTDVYMNSTVSTPSKNSMAANTTLSLTLIIIIGKSVLIEKSL